MQNIRSYFIWICYTLEPHTTIEIIQSFTFCHVKKERSFKHCTNDLIVIPLNVL